MPRRGNKSLRITKLREPVYSTKTKIHTVGIIKKPKKRGKVITSYLPYAGRWQTRLQLKATATNKQTSE